MSNLRINHNQYWFDSKNNVLYDLGNRYHHEIIDDYPDLFKDVDLSGHLPTKVTYHLIDSDWARLTYDREKKFLSIHSIKNRGAVLSLRKIIKEKQIIVDSLYLEIDNMNIKEGLSGENLDIYIDRGKIKLTENRESYKYV